MRKLPPLIALRAFEAAARHMSFKAAAVELGRTPTAISHQIRLLEMACGQPLFRRRPRPIALTVAGAKLFPVLRDGFDAISAAISQSKGESSRQTLRVTTTNAFASRWLVPRLPLWRDAQPQIELEVIGTDELLDLRGGDADIAVRYAPSPPPRLVSFELLRDRYWAVGSVKLLAAREPIRRPSDLAHYPLVHIFWPESVDQPPTWQRWLDMARATDPGVAAVDPSIGPLFREELHAIDAVLAGQGIAVASDVLVGSELASGELVKVSNLALPGFGFYVTYVAGHARPDLIDTFTAWLRSVA